MDFLSEGLKNWKLRLILSALLCIMGLASMISMMLGIFIDLSVYDKSIVAIAIFMVGIPTYLIVSGLAGIDEKTIAKFLNEKVSELSLNPEVLIKDEADLDEQDRSMKEKLHRIFSEKPVHHFLPDRPVKQAYFLFLISLIISFCIYYTG